MASFPPPEGNTVMLTRRLSPIDTVVGIQERLNQTGFDSGPEDGINGPQTKAAIKRFQQFCKLRAGGPDPRIIDSGPIDGIAGPITKNALLTFYGS